jgi:hypothetical protein
MPRTTEPFRPIATRTLDVDGKPSYILRVAEPMPEGDGSIWVCAYEIDRPSGLMRSEIRGADGMQALLHALALLGVYAMNSDENLAGSLTWFDQSAHFGFPPPEAIP